MLRQTSKNFRARFLLEFTRNLIRGTGTYKEIAIKKEVKKVLHQEKEQEKIRPKIDVPLVVHEKIRADAKRVRQIRKIEKEREKILARKPMGLTPRIPSLVQKFQKRPGYIKAPELRLPETVSHLKPMPTSQQISLEKLDPLVRDSMVRAIECLGPNEKIIVTGLMGRKSTPISLTREEIDDIIARFSEATRIPVFEGVSKIVFGKLILTAVVSQFADPVFIITKMAEPHSVPAPLFR